MLPVCFGSKRFFRRIVRKEIQITKMFVVNRLYSLRPLAQFGEGFRPVHHEESNQKGMGDP